MKLYRKYVDAFCSAHNIPGHPKCGNKHGHNYHAEVGVEVSWTPEEVGLQFDFGNFDDIMKPAFEILDHRDISEMFKCSCVENIAKRLWKTVGFEFASKYNATLCYLRIWETDKNSCSIEGPWEP
jgi:6-pyruvoyl-tetrahydropterin synthase